MTLHLGILALTLAIATFAALRLRRRRDAAGMLLFAVAITAAILETTVAAREARFGMDWTTLAERELEGRTRAIVTFLRDEGSDALESIREIGRDPDTRALLSEEPQLARTARRPVFLDLMGRFPRNRSGGVTIYDAGGRPRAWSGWSPTATMSLDREPSATSEAIGIRQGNIYTLLEAIHPIRDERDSTLGFVVYQEPLRVQFPLENRFLRVDDVLSRLEGGGGVRADVALELEISEGRDARSIRPGAMKLAVSPDIASATAAIDSHDGDTVGRVSLSGLARSRLQAERLDTVEGIREWLLLLVALLVGLRLWSRCGDLPPPVAVVLRVALLALARGAFLVRPLRGHLDPLGLFDPSWFASIRFGGLLRSPGDLLLTALIVVLAGRELRQLAQAGAVAVSGFSRRHPVVTLLPAAGLALLVGSLVGLHWSRVLDVARNANVPLYGGFDPFTSPPVAALELALLFLGTGLLLFADALISLSLGLLSRFPRLVRGAMVAGLAAFGSAVKMPTEGVTTDFLWPIPALAAIAAFRLLARRWDRPGGAAIVVIALLGAIASFGPSFEGIESRRRELVELFALEHTESPSNSRHFLLATTLEQIEASEELRRVMEDGPQPAHANLAFILWAQSPLANVPSGCHLRLFDANGTPFSSFSLGYPPELRQDGRRTPSAPRFRREEIGSARVDVYTGDVTMVRGDVPIGSVEISMAYHDDFSRPGGAARPATGLFTNLSAPDEFLRFRREVPDRVDRYRGEVLVSSTDLEGGLGKVVPPIIVQALAGRGVGGRWVERRIGGRLYDVYCVRERDGDLTVGYLTFGIERSGLLAVTSLLARSCLVSLVLAAGIVAFLMAFSWVAPATVSRQRLSLPSLGFRERVIGGFLLVSLLPTVLLGFAGRGLFIQEKRREFQKSLEEDLRVSVELLGRRLSDAARNAAGSDEVLDLMAQGGSYRTLSRPASVDGIVVMSPTGQILGSSRSADLDMAVLASEVDPSAGAVEFFRRRGSDLYACALVPIARPSDSPRSRSAAVLAFHRIDPVLAAELERRTGSAVSFFAAGLLSATSKPELYQSEILSDLVEPLAFLKIELEGARRTVLESRVGATSFLSSYAPLPGGDGEPVGVLATLSPFQGGGLDLEASLVLSRIYFLCLLVFTGAVSAAVLLANRLTNPISLLTAGAERIRAGGPGHQITAQASGEIGRLVRSFNLMSARLAESEARDRERREYIEAIIRHVGSGVVSFDAEGRIATVNDAAARILQVEAEEVLGTTPDGPLRPAGLAALVGAVEPVRTGVRDEVVDEIEIPPGNPHDSAEGELRTLRLVVTRLADMDGQAQGAVAVFEDLTDLIRSKKITAWAEMARQVAHEIKNPLTPMKLSAQHLQQAWRDKHPKLEQILMESTDTIIDRCEALRRIAVEFSDYARMPGRAIRREDLGELLLEARRLYGDTEERRVAISVEAPESELWTRVDRDEILRLFINLFENSIQAMPDGGDLRVEAGRANGRAEVTIHDTGVGIPPENLIRIFEPSFSTKTGGAGLGLPICKAIMEDYGGSIDIASITGAGTTVTLRFPVDETKKKDGEA